jgi:glycosyltransferase involved in cell wall biosynthesis
MRVMFLSVSGELGGAERALLDMLASLRHRQPEWPLAVVIGGPGPLAHHAATLGVTATVLPIPASLAKIGETDAGRSTVRAFELGASLLGAAAPVGRYVTALRGAIQAFAPDVLHTNGFKMHVLGAWAHPRATAVVWHLHDYVACRPFSARLLRWNRAACSGVIANSASVAGDAAETFGPDLTVTPVLNAVDLERFSGVGPEADLDALAGLPPAPPNTVRIGLIATFGRWKGHGTLLDAIAKLPGDLPIRAYLVGGALYQTGGSQYTEAELRAYARRLGVEGRVGFTGFVEDAARAMRALDIVVHASTSPEPFGLVIAEAMACERAVIASDAGGAREIFTNGVDAIGHRPGDAGQLAAAIEDLVRHPARRRQLGVAARRTVERRFDRRRLAADLAEVYERALRAA